MKIVFDNIVFFLQKSGGISVVWYELIKRFLNEKNNDIKFLEYTKTQENIFRKKITIPIDQLIIESSFLFKVKRYINPKLYNLKNRFIFHSSYYRTCSNKNAINITTVHDFIYEKYRKGFRKKLHCNQKNRAIRKSDVIICISENTKKDLMNFLPDIDEKKIHVVYNGVSDEYFQLLKTEKNDICFIENQYIVFIGGRDGYKRFDIAIDVAEVLNLNLLIIGGGDLTSKEKKILTSKLGQNNFKHLLKITNKEINIIYNNAFCLLYPSIYEGFGLPVLEAQRAGCPVVAYNGSSVKEIAGESPLLFNDYSIENICNCIKNNLTDKTLRAEIIKKGLINSQKYSWEKTFIDMRKIYLEIFD